MTSYINNFVVSHLVEVGDDLVEQPEALHALVVHLRLGVEVGEAGDGGEHHAHGVVVLGVQLLLGAESKRQVLVRCLEFIYTWTLYMINVIILLLLDFFLCK